MDWIILKEEIKEMLLSRNLANPNIRLSALEKLDTLFRKRFPEIIRNPLLLLNHDKETINRELSKLKPNGKLNSAELSVINNMYQILSSQK